MSVKLSDSNMDWNALIDEQENATLKSVARGSQRQNIPNISVNIIGEDSIGAGDTEPFVEHPPTTSPNTGTDESAGSTTFSDGEIEDELQIHCNDTDILCTDIECQSPKRNWHYEKVKTTDDTVANNKRLDNTNTMISTKRHPKRTRQKKTADDKITSRPYPSTPLKVKRRVGRPPPVYQSLMLAKCDDRQQKRQNTTTPTNSRNWILRWVRAGHEHLVYDLCNCNEMPNVVFAALCYQEGDVYSMMLRNCNGKRRYWYDKPKRIRRSNEGPCVGDFERAMVWRANAVGRACTSPGYDLAAFSLQNVTTDKRFLCSLTTTNPLIIVTTDDMLTEPSVYSLLSGLPNGSGPNRRQPASNWNQRTRSIYRCCECRDPAQIVTHDNASVPTYTCWQHSASYMMEASADRTRVCNSVIVDMQFLSEDEPHLSGELVCRLRLVDKNDGKIYPNGDRGCSVLTIAELVSVPIGSYPADITVRDATTRRQTTVVERPVDLEKAHASCCSDRHHNHEDLFPSVPTKHCASGGNVTMYDTTIGRVLDQMHCIASVFQK